MKRDATKIDFLKAFDSVPRDRVLTKIAATGVDLRVVLWLKEFNIHGSVHRSITQYK